MKGHWLIGIVLGAGCGGGGGEGLSSSKRASELTDAELGSFCKWMVEHEYEAATLEQFCTIDGVEQTASKAECEALRADCINAQRTSWPLEYEADLAYCDTLTRADIPESCSVTVGQLRACFIDLDAQLANAARSASCDEPGMTYAADLPSSCEPVRESCAQWLEF